MFDAIVSGSFGVVLGFLLSEIASWIRNRHAGQTALLQCVVELSFIHQALRSHLEALNVHRGTLLEFELPDRIGLERFGAGLSWVKRRVATDIMWLYMRANVLERLSHGISAIQADTEDLANPDHGPVDSSIDQLVAAFKSWQQRLTRLNISPDVLRVLPEEARDALKRGNAIEL